MMNRTVWKITSAVVLLLALLIFPSCEKQPEPGGPSAETETFPIRAAYAGEDLPDHLELVADEGEYAAKILLTADVPVESFHFFALIDQDRRTGGPVIIGGVDHCGINRLAVYRKVYHFFGLPPRNAPMP